MKTESDTPPENSKVILGTPVPPRDDIILGPPRNPPTGDIPVFTAAVRQPGSSKVYSSGLDQPRARSVREESGTANRFAVRPSILIVFGFAIFMLIVALSFAKPPVDNLPYNDPAINKYEEFRHAQPKSDLPKRERISEALNAIAYLENAGREQEAKEAWQSLLVLIGYDKKDPLYDLAMEHLRR